MSKWDKRTRGIVLAGVSILLIALVLSGWWWTNHQRQELEEQRLAIVESTSEVYLVLWRNAVDAEIEGLHPNGFPVAITDELLSKHHSEDEQIELLTNPVNGLITRHVGFDDSDRAGNFTYINLPPGIWNGVECIESGYYLIAHGQENMQGEDVDGDGKDDHVLMVDEGSLDFSNGGPFDECSFIPNSPVITLAEAIGWAYPKPGRPSVTYEPFPPE